MSTPPLTHTPGPWKPLHLVTRKLWAVVTDTGAPIHAVIVDGVNDRDGNAEANARLIASAPSLLAERDLLAAEVTKLHAACESARIALANPGSANWRETALADLNAGLNHDAP